MTEENYAELEKLTAPPHSIEAEQSVIGGLLLKPESWDEVYDVVRPQHFYHESNAIIFKAIGDLYENNRSPDVVTVTEELKRINKLEYVGGIQYLGTIAKNIPSAANIKAYAEIVRERAVLRNMISISYEVSEKCFRNEGNSSEIIEFAESKIVKVAESTVREGGPVHVNEALKETVDSIDQLSRSDSNLSGLATGFYDLDKKTSGLQPGELTIIAGRPSMGKTAFSMCIAENVIVDLASDDGAVLVFSLEMPKDALMKRMIASLGGVPLERLKNGNLLDEDWQKMTNAVAKLNKKPFLIDDTGGLTPMEMKIRSRKVAREYGGLKLIVVDYLQLMRVPELMSNPTAEVGEISKALKNLAKEHNCPVIAISQLNRESEKRAGNGYRPILSDLRSSGQIEQDADLVMFVHRDEYYDEETMRKGVADIIIAKQRNGPIGTICLNYVQPTTSFKNMRTANEYQ